ncbi:MAG TPA: ATP-binding protein, partial [Actinomycetes bacterium]
LSGAEPARRWTEPIPLPDVVRAAAGEVEDYGRVELLAIAEIGVAGHVVADVVHLLAELIENAASYSPPNTPVHIGGNDAASGYVLEIEDRGIGMSDQELLKANERITHPPAVNFAPSPLLGLQVVGMLGQRHGIKVQLRHSWYGGVTALVLLPSAITGEFRAQEPLIVAGQPERAVASSAAAPGPAGGSQRLSGYPVGLQHGRLTSANPATTGATAPTTPRPGDAGS